ncbi:Jag N-terminal domain-containing protein [Globicatella sp. PHS-GS-PNBC-21-1553]|uniref:Jag N-terminal domain-containing protein n=1 Tax=Globicatella sp. PHS-GS-PNBC-21-1553 TaxID=2885764 RepID=UPI00298EDBE8|nr:Jag N-terminal domain-containing protein [Globicatella sp. PHS-GS-PNBC-21-1553]WPC09549.1 Jag N-terminal domain-containing protein [Globicatella sp. PHS-GS-PNBC-21-1553]
MEHSTTIRAESVDKAIKIGLTKLNISESEANINIISEGKKGLFGFGKQDAIVEISKNASISELTAEIEKQVEEKR